MVSLRQTIQGITPTWLTALISTPEDPQLAEFRSGIEIEMAKDERLADCPETRMVSKFVQVDPAFCESLHSAGFRTPENGQYNFTKAAVFIADINRQEHIEDGRAVPFLGIQTAEGDFQLLDVSNFGSPHVLKDLNGDAARRLSNTFRNMLNDSSHTTVITDAPDRLFFANKEGAPEPIPVA